MAEEGMPTKEGLPSLDSEISLVDGAQDDNELALKGVVLLLNNKWDDSTELFDKYKSQSSVMHFGATFVCYLRAILSMEDEKIAASVKAFEDLEKKCDTRTSLLKRIKKKLKNQSNAPTISQEDKWMSQIIVADSLFYQAVLTFTNQEIPSYLKGGWLLRKAWKIYEKVQGDIKKQYERSLKSKNGAVTVTVEQATEALSEGEDKVPVPPSEAKDLAGENGAVPNNSKVTETLTTETLMRLLGAVRFGYGMFQLGLSMIPDKVLKLIEFLGFEANREEGLKALEFCSISTDMRSPLAVLSLLWYHTIMKSFFASGNELSSAELKETEELVIKYQDEYPESSLFLFFKGRLCRLQKNLDGALQEYDLAKECANGQKELINAALFEKAWVNMMKLNFDVSYPCFTKLLMDSKWSKCFYTYMQGLCAGCLGRLDEAHQTLKTVPDLMKKKTNQIESFVVERAKQFKKLKLTEDICGVLVLELVYMWNTIAQCNTEELERMLATLGELQEKKFFHLRSLIEGAIYKQMGDREFALQCFREALARHEGLKHDYHIAAHTLFEMGTIYIEDQEKQSEGRKMLLKAKDGFKEYHFENRLNIRIRNVLKSLPAK